MIEDDGLYCANPVDFRLSTAESVGGAASWNRTSATTATQVPNSDGTVLLTEFDGFAAPFSVDISTSDTDDDLFGIALGISPGELAGASPNFLYLDWKQVEQQQYGTNAEVGLAPPSAVAQR